MPHVDELLGITTLASMGLFVAVSLQPLEAADAVPAVSAEQRHAPVVPRAQGSDMAMPAGADAINAARGTSEGVAPRRTARRSPA